MNVTMMVIPEPEEGTTTVLELNEDHPQPFLSGGGDVNVLCGECGFYLCQGIATAAQVQSMVLRCPRCSACNETRH